MNKFKRVLSDEEMTVVINNGCTSDLFSLAERVEKVVLAKLAEQEPVMYARTYYGEIDWGETCVTEKNDGALMQATDMRRKDFVRHGYEIIPLYAHPYVSESGESVTRHLEYIKRYQKWRRGEDETMSEAGLDPKQIGESLDWLIGVVEDHIPDIGKMVFDPDAALTLAERALSVEITERLADELIQFARKLYEKYTQTDHIADAGKMITPLTQRKIQSIIDSGEYREMKGATVLVNDRGHAAIVNHGGAFYWVDNVALAREFDGAGVGADSDHIADMRKKVPEGWQLVPKEPTEEMHHAARDWSVEKYGKAIGSEASHGCYQAMLAAAPKHKGSNDD